MRKEESVWCPEIGEEPGGVGKISEAVAIQIVVPIRAGVPELPGTASIGMRAGGSRGRRWRSGADGSGGAPITSPRVEERDLEHPSVCMSAEHSFTRIDLNGTLATVVTINDRGEELERFSLRDDDGLLVEANATPTVGLAPLSVRFTGNVTGGVAPYRLDLVVRRRHLLQGAEPDAHRRIARGVRGPAHDNRWHRDVRVGRSPRPAPHLSRSGRGEERPPPDPPGNADRERSRSERGPRHRRSRSMIQYGPAEDLCNSKGFCEINGALGLEYGTHFERFFVKTV